MSKVYLVGTGPGDPELLSIKALRVLRQAEVVLYDKLVNPLLLYEAPKEANLIYVGKAPKNHTMQQEDIQNVLIDYAKEGKIVVRLKGGDPAVYGRVGEEMEALEEAGIPYEVIPGITTVSAASVYCGLSITKRYEREKIFICTPTAKLREFVKEPLVSIAEGGVVAMYMGMGKLENICNAFLQQGADKDLSVMVIQWATLGRQKKIVGTLATISNQVEYYGIYNPAIIIIGNFSKDEISKLSWFENKPLFGKRVIFISDTSMEFDEILKLTSLGCDFFPIFIGDIYDSRFDEIYSRILLAKEQYDIIYSKNCSKKDFVSLCNKLNI
ncbi:MAG: uroporphyrinogen-III C-methyltransferase [Miniphocaeibacter sp.]|uniref:uroporphyrinogen-III C-methyltransferase n=1 Tax=Miniphocaeibacter sp. TaxID=3100973 RepID=UPI001810AFA9|nr:uroporphyrinogen-III C-methyltransferase [Gallicola sp.]